MSRNNIPFLRLDGTLSQKQRERVIRQFSEDSSILVCDFLILGRSLVSLLSVLGLIILALVVYQVLLMSLKAGGVGVNLTAASNAFVLVGTNFSYVLKCCRDTFS